MRREVEVYINANEYGQNIAYQRLDLFEEESINVTNSIKDIRDIAKVFTDYSQQFNVPASTTNNKLFKHYYNFDVSNGYDARVKREALIKINGEDYKSGFVALSDVSMKNQNPYSYKIVFYGKTINLKRLFGDNKIDELANYADAYLSKFNHIYTEDYARNGLKNGYNLSGSNLIINTSSTTAGDLCYPFISSKSHYYWDTSNNAPSLNEDVVSRNIEANASGNDRGLRLIDLKPAIRMYHIILAIEEKYGIQFTKNGSNDFFSQSNLPFYELYLWLHREKGDLNEQIEEDVQEIYLNDYTFTNTSPTGNDDPRSSANKNLVASVNNFSPRIKIKYEYKVTITPAVGGLYSLEMLDSFSGEIISPVTNATDLTGDGNPITIKFIFERNVVFIGETTFAPVLKVKTRGGITSFVLSGLSITKTTQEYENISSFGGFNWSLQGQSSYVANYTITNPATSTSTFNISAGFELASNLPNMKVIDFLTSIFKMFNLVAFYDDRRILSNGSSNPDFDKIKVMTLDNYYSEGTSYDIGRYLYTDKHSVGKANIFSEINFKYSSPSTFAIINNNEIVNDEFGNESLNNTNTQIESPLAFDGGKYDVELGFEHMVFERMRDQSNSTTLTTVQWGWMVSDDEFPVLAKPLVVFCKKESTTSYLINTQDGNNFTTIDTYIRPSNTLGDGLQTINFGSENDEFYLDRNDVSLFETYYDNYIIPIYNERARLSKFKVVLPAKLINKLRLNDKIVISGKPYKINKIKININTGKADLELINEV